MLENVAKQFFNLFNDPSLRRLTKIVQAINSLEPMMQILKDEDIRAYTTLLRSRLTQGETYEEILVEAFSAVREASKRTLGQRPFDVQILGGLILHQGKIAEMKTGEGKTLVATLPVYLNALSGYGVHVVTVNDYLARRDAEWMGQIYCLLGLSVGVVIHGMDDSERKLAYACDITYVTNNELGFDYLRDNMKFRLDEMVQRPFYYAIVDEVDSILIDEARTPLIISGPSEDFSELYIQVDKLIPQLGPSHFEKDEKARAVTLTEDGVECIEILLREMHLLRGGSLYDISNMALVHHVNQALRAHKLFTRDVDYIVKDNKVIIIDEFTGRMMEGRRYSDGLHQALEAKERVPIQRENQTLASITFQNYFRLYPKLAGMTGTAITEANEFQEIYGLDVVEIPTNAPIIRQDMNDEIYRTTHEKFFAVLANIRYCYTRQQPVLVGTTSIEKSELLSNMLKAEGIPHKVLNALYHEQEAHIIAEAGVPGAVTIATNMAGRGTDIQLGGSTIIRLQSEVKASSVSKKEAPQYIGKTNTEINTGREVALESGGLFVIGTERHESRRIDNQLRGRSGRQGDPGVSRFFLALEDDLMRIFGSERMDGILQKLGLQEGEAITHPWINKALERAQQKVEARNFDIRKNLLRFDDVINDQRKVIYEQRREVMEAENVHQTILDMCHQVIDELVARVLSVPNTSEQQNIARLSEECTHVFGLDVPLEKWLIEESIMEDDLKTRLHEVIRGMMTERAELFRPDLWRMIEKNVLLQILDQTWKEHLLTLDYLRQGIGLRAYGQRDPLNEYKKEAFSLFERMLAHLRERVTSVLSHIRATSTGAQSETFVKREVLTKNKTRRNEPCPCGSGKKFKYCHGILA